MGKGVDEALEALRRFLGPDGAARGVDDLLADTTEEHLRWRGSSVGAEDEEVEALFEGEGGDARGGEALLNTDADGDAGRDAGDPGDHGVGAFAESVRDLLAGFFPGEDHVVSAGDFVGAEEDDLRDAEARGDLDGSDKELVVVGVEVAGHADALDVASELGEGDDDADGGSAEEPVGDAAEPAALEAALAIASDDDEVGVKFGAKGEDFGLGVAAQDVERNAVGEAVRLAEEPEFFLGELDVLFGEARDGAFGDL